MSVKYVCAWRCASVWIRIMHREASAHCSITQMLPPCLLIPSLGQLSPHRRDQTRTMPVWQLPFSVQEPCGKGQPSAAALWRRFWIATVQSPACLQSKAQRPHHACLFQSPQEIWGWITKECHFSQTIWCLMTEVLMWGLWVNLPCLFLPVTLWCFTLHPSYCFPSLICESFFEFQQFPTLSSVCSFAVRYCYHDRVDTGCETAVEYHLMCTDIPAL